MKRILIIAGLLLFVFNVSIFSQLSDRVNNASTLKVGTRPIKGDMGVYLGISVREIKEFIDDTEYVYKGIPLISLKYYASDKWVVRLGVQVMQKSIEESGPVDPNVDGSMLTERVFRESTLDLLLTPGFEYHFTNSNLIDVYVGGLLPIGWSKSEYSNQSSYSTGAYDIYTRTKNGIVYGYELFVGLQAFIADLPLAIGFELGVSGLGESKDKYKHESNVSIGGITSNQLYYTVDEAAMGVRYMDLTSKNFEAEGNIRISISYFFGK